MSLDVKKLNSFSQEVYHKLMARHPEWEKYASLDEFEGQYLIIKIDPAIPSIFPIEITTVPGDDKEITVYFGPSHIHTPMYRPFGRNTVDRQIEKAEEIVQKIVYEEFISIQTKKNFLRLLSRGIVPVKKYDQLLRNGKLYKAVSWKGTYNYPKDGTHLDWELRDKSE